MQWIARIASLVCIDRKTKVIELNWIGEMKGIVSTKAKMATEESETIVFKQ